MFILKKLFKLRDQSGGQGADKPFLEHLEDLRDVIVRVVLTLLVSTVLCYVFRDTLLDVLRRPIEQVWTESEKSKLPETISPETWEKAKKAANRTAGLSATQRLHFYAQFDDKKLSYYAECASYYRTALVLEDKDKRKKFIKDIPELEDDKREFVLKLLEKNPSDAVNARGDVVFMRSLKPTETFMLAIKLSVFAGIIISFPLILFFILQFVIPGLKEKERKAMWPAMLIGFGLFLTGVLFCYFWVLPKALDFFFSYGKDMGVENEWRIGEYISFATQFTLIFGLAFELPVVVMTLVKIGLLGYETMRNTRSYAIVGILVVAAVITPTGDALTLMMLAAPMYFLYEICIWLAYFGRKKELEEEAQEMEDIRKYNEQLKEYEAEHGDEDYHHEDYDDPHHHEDYPEYDEHHKEPRIVPVPGRISTDSDHEFIEDDDHSEYDDGYPEDDEGEGSEEDDGEVEEYNSEQVYTEEDEANHDEAEALTEDQQIDFNPGASFEAEEVEEDETEEKDDSDEESDDKKKDKPNDKDKK